MIPGQQQFLTDELELQRLLQSVAGSPVSATISPSGRGFSQRHYGAGSTVSLPQQQSSLAMHLQPGTPFSATISPSGRSSTQQLYNSGPASSSAQQQLVLNMHMQRLMAEQHQLQILRQSMEQGTGIPTSGPASALTAGALWSGGLPRSFPQADTAAPALNVLHPHSGLDAAFRSLAASSQVPFAYNQGLLGRGVGDTSSSQLREASLPGASGAANNLELHRTMLLREELNRRLMGLPIDSADNTLLFRERTALLAAPASANQEGTHVGLGAFSTHIPLREATDNHPASLSSEARLGDRWQPTVASSLTGGREFSLPVGLHLPRDHLKLSTYQCLLRQQIQVFRATEDDVSTHTRGRNKPIMLGQVGIRCRHCAHLPVARRKKGSTYFPATLMGLYQAAQNMSTTHMQGTCSEMPESVKQELESLIAVKAANSTGGRPYWAEAAASLGLVDSSDGIRFVLDVPQESLGQDE
jgi:hypothetical protein